MKQWQSSQELQSCFTKGVSQPSHAVLCNRKGQSGLLPLLSWFLPYTLGGMIKKFFEALALV